VVPPPLPLRNGKLVDPIVDDVSRGWRSEKVGKTFGRLLERPGVVVGVGWFG